VQRLFTRERKVKEAEAEVYGPPAPARPH